MNTGKVHFFRLKKMGRRRSVYPVHEMGEASRDAIIPNADTYSVRSKLVVVLNLVEISKAMTTITLTVRPTDKLLNLVVSPKIELFPGIMIVSG